MPGYLWWLLNVFEIPEALRSVRFGVKEWHHPGLSAALFDDTPAAEWLRLIDAAEFSSPDFEKPLRLWEMASHAEKKSIGDVWEGSAIELEKLMQEEPPRFKDDPPKLVCSVAREARKLALHNKVDRIMGRLREDQPERVAHHRGKFGHRWIIARPV